MGKKLKNKDIAARLGLSGTLVSLVINNKADQHGIKKETQERVLAVARQMGYFNEVAAKGETAAVEDKPGIIGMIVPSMSDPFIYEITPYLQKAFASIGLGFSVFTRDPDDLRFSRLTLSLKKFFSGMILVGDAAEDHIVRTLNRDEYPLVLLEKNIKRVRLNTVCSDKLAGAGIMTEHLAGLGYKNLLIISSEGSAGSDKEMLDELKNATKKSKGFADVQFTVARIPKGLESLDMDQIEPFLRPPHRTDAIIAVSPELVFPLLIALKEKNIRVPNDVALVSMEDGIGFDLLTTPVTRLRRPLSGMALKTANTIWSEIKNQGKSKYKRQVNLTPDLVIRSSCGSYLK
ncbi:MAG TPA: LacI family DNA-binding transcriptional regulator [Bacteroidales bacterium]|nr:LacI family DNA-binding transcriptional regulator [Bacteroidales bacterium]